jgi:hypothetical protein
VNRLTINTATPDGCILCGDVGKIRVDVADFEIIGFFRCPACTEDTSVREFLIPLLDYVGRPTPGPVVA